MSEYEREPDPDMPLLFGDVPEEMTPREAYLRATTALQAVAAPLLELIDLRTCEQAIYGAAMVHTIGPIADPTLYRDGLRTLESNERLLRGLRDFVGVLESERDRVNQEGGS